MEQILKVFRIFDRPLSVAGLFHSKVVEVAIKPIIAITPQASSYFSHQKANIPYLSPVPPFLSEVSPVFLFFCYLPCVLSADSIRQGIGLCWLVFCRACSLRLN